MATRTQGVIFGCLIALAGVLVVVSVFSWFLGGIGGDSGLGLGGGSHIGLVVIDGPISEVRPELEELEDLRHDGSIKAVVLRVDSPGGEVGASQELHDAVARLADEKPVVVSVGSVAASGAYYAAMAADSIVCTPGAVVGSIGVILSYPTAATLLDKLGVEWRVYKSGPLKDMGSFSRNPTEEEESVFDGIISDVYDQFVTAVADDRGLTREDVLSLADGRIFTGRQALEAGLVDRLGDYQDAIAMAASMGGVPPEPPEVRRVRARIPLLDLIDRLLHEEARSTWGPHLEYRLR
jgi:protease IV